MMMEDSDVTYEVWLYVYNICKLMFNPNDSIVVSPGYFQIGWPEWGTFRKKYKNVLHLIIIYSVRNARHTTLHVYSSGKN